MEEIAGKSFIATLMGGHESATGPINYLRGHNLGAGGWLVHGAQVGDAAPLMFHYLEHTEDRIHFQISVAGDDEYAGAVLGVNGSGYLGFYDVSEVSDFWKIEVLHQEGENDFFFMLRDHRGHRVSATQESLQRGSFWTGSTLKTPVTTFGYLSVETGTPLTLRATVSEWR